MDAVPLGWRGTPPTAGRAPTGRPACRACVAALLLLGASPGALGSPPDPGSPAPPTDIRREILSGFRFIPRQAEPAEASPILAQGAAAPAAPDAAGPDIVSMAPYTVRENVRMEKLHADIVEAQAEARTAATMTRLGVGLHEVPVGNFHLFAGTVFYIPFVVGIGISW